MARTPDVKKFNKWFKQNETRSMEILTTDFSLGNLAKTCLFKEYRRTARLLPDKEEPQPAPKPASCPKPSTTPTSLQSYFQSTYGSQETLIEPIAREELIERINNDGSVKAVVRVALLDIIECKSESELKEIMAEFLTGTTAFDDIDEAIDYEFIGGEPSGLYFEVSCISLPVEGERIAD